MAVCETKNIGHSPSLKSINTIMAVYETTKMRTWSIT